VGPLSSALCASMTRLAYSDAKVANQDGFRWEIAHGAVTRRPPIPLYTMVARTGGYAYDVGVWGLSIVQGPFSVAPCQPLKARFATFFIAVWQQNPGRPQRTGSRSRWRCAQPRAW
jgi:hypothetical protein